MTEKTEMKAGQALMILLLALLVIGVALVFAASMWLLIVAVPVAAIGLLSYAAYLKRHQGREPEPRRVLLSSEGPEKPRMPKAA